MSKITYRRFVHEISGLQGFQAYDRIAVERMFKPRAQRLAVS